MVRKSVATMLALCLLTLSFSNAAFAEVKKEKGQKFAAKVKANIEKLGTGKDARVEVKLKDGTKLKGYIEQRNESNFIVFNEKTSTQVEVQYPQVSQVKGNNLATGVKIALVAGLIAALIAIIYFAGNSD